MEENYENFTQLFNLFLNNINHLQNRILDNYDNIAERDRLQYIYDKLKNLDVKSRLAFGIEEIRLNPFFVDEKQDDLKLCHLLYYKLADLWFAYESYILFYNKISQTSKNKILWLDAILHSNYTNSPEITNSLNLVRQNLSQLYNAQNDRNSFSEYLNYCIANSKDGQLRRLQTVINKIQNSDFNFSHTDVLTITYSIRNNFVHNGETTVVPNIFGFQNKVRLLLVLHPYLSIILLKSSSITFQSI